jgi:hypothetical protein
MRLGGSSGRSTGGTWPTWSRGISRCASEGGLRAAVFHAFCEAADSCGVVSLVDEVFAGDEPVGVFAGAGRLDVGGLLAGLPAAGDDERAGDGRALGAVNVACVRQPYSCEVIAGKQRLSARLVEFDQHPPVIADVEHMSALAVLEPLDAGLVVLLDQRDAVALPDAVVDAGDIYFDLAEFAALGTVVLGTGVNAMDLQVGGVADQRDLLDWIFLCQCGPFFDCALNCPSKRVHSTRAHHYGY